MQLNSLLSVKMIAKGPIHQAPVDVTWWADLTKCRQMACLDFRRSGTGESSQGKVDRSYRKWFACLHNLILSKLLQICLFKKEKGRKKRKKKRKQRNSPICLADILSGKKKQLSMHNWRDRIGILIVGHLLSLGVHLFFYHVNSLLQLWSCQW